METKLTAEKLYDIYNSNCEKNNELLQKENKTEPLSLELAEAVVSLMDAYEYNVYLKEKTGEESSFIVVDRQLKEEYELDVIDLLRKAEYPVFNNDYYDFDNPDKNPFEVKCYKLFSDFFEYKYPDSYRFQSKTCFDQEVVSDNDINKTLEMMGVKNVSIPDTYFETLKEAVWNLSKRFKVDKEYLDVENKEYNTFVNNYLKKECFRLDWNKKEKGTYTQFRTVNNLAEIDPDNKIQQEVLIKNISEHFNINVDLNTAKAFLEMANYDDSSFYFEFDTFNGNFVQLNDANGITDVETSVGMLSYYQNEIEYRLNPANQPISESLKETAVVLKEFSDSIKTGIHLNYAFPEYLTKKDGEISSKINDIDNLLIYEEPRWSFKNPLNNEVMNYLKEHDSSFYNEIIEYQKNNPDGFYFDIGKSLRYDDCYGYRGDFSNESLDDKLDDLFFVRYSSDKDDGNLGDGGEEIYIQDKELSSKFNSMIKEHVQHNIERYNEYKKARNELIDKELADKHNNDIYVLYEEDGILNSNSCPKKLNLDNRLIRLQEGQLTPELEVLLGLNKEGDLTHNFGWFKYAELNDNGLLVKEYPVGLWDQRQDDKGNPLNPDKIDIYVFKDRLASEELINKVENNFKEKLNKEVQEQIKVSFEKKVREGVFSGFDANKVLDSMDKLYFEEFEEVGKLNVGGCSFNLYCGFAGEEPNLFISPVRTKNGEDINGAISLSLSKIKQALSYNTFEAEIKGAIIGKIDELDSKEDVQKTVATCLDESWFSVKIGKLEIGEKVIIDDPLNEELNSLKPFKNCNIEMYFNEKEHKWNAQIHLQNKDVINLSFEADEKDLRDFWYGFEYNGNEYDMNICDGSDYGNGGWIYPVDKEGHVDTVIFEQMDSVNIYSRERNNLQIWEWKNYDDLSGHIESPDGKVYFSYDWTTKEYQYTEQDIFDSFVDADPARDTSLAAFKEYAQNYIANNIVKDSDIKLIFENHNNSLERNKMKDFENETFEEKFDRVEKEFAGIESSNGIEKPSTFKEMYNWVKQEFPEKDDESALLETTSRMIFDNIIFGELGVESYDDVYGFGDGAEYRYELSDKVAHSLIKGDLNINEVQDFVDSEAIKIFNDIRKNDDFEVVYRINEAFLVAHNIYPNFAELYEHDVPEDGFYKYSLADKKAYIEKAWNTLKENWYWSYDDDEPDYFYINCNTENKSKLFFSELEILIKGHDAALNGIDSLGYIRPNKLQLKNGLQNNWESFDILTTGYGEFGDFGETSELPDSEKVMNICRIDDMMVFDSDQEAAEQYSIDHNVRLFKERENIWIGNDDYDKEYLSYPDTPENHEVLKPYLIDEPVLNKFDWSEFTEKDFELLKRNLDNPAERMYGSVHIGSISCDLQYREGDKFDLDFYVLGDKGYGGVIEFDEKSIPYSENAITSLNLDEIKDMTYDLFKDWYQDVLIRNIEEENYTYEARRPTVNWNNEEQCLELYRTKLIESARLNEIVIAPYTRDEEHKRDVEAVRQWLSEVSAEKNVSDEMVYAVIDNIGRVQDDKPGDFLKVHKDGTIEHISALGTVVSEPLEVLGVISSFAEEHAAVSEKDSQQNKDKFYIDYLYDSVYKKTFEGDSARTTLFIKDLLEKESGIGVDVQIVEEICSRYNERELIFVCNKSDNTLKVYDNENKKYSSPLDASDILKQVISWDDKELSELHPGTVDDKDINKIKLYIDELEHISEQIAYNKAVTSLNFNDNSHCQKVKEMLGNDFIMTDEEAKVLLSYATHFDDGTSEYGLSEDGHLHFKTNQDDIGWSFITEDSMQRDFLASAFDGVAIFLDSDRKDDVVSLNSFFNKNQKFLAEFDDNTMYKSSLKDAIEKINAESKNVRITHSVTFPCGFTFPKDVYENDPGENKREEYRWKIYNKIKERFEFNDNDTETEYFKGDIPSNSSFNIYFSVPVPNEIKTNPVKVNEWIDSVERFVKEECGCTFIAWQGGERYETIFEEKENFFEKNNTKPNWEELKVAFSLNDDYINKLQKEIKDSMPDITENNLYEEAVFRIIESNYDMHNFNSHFDGLAPELEDVINSQVIEQHCNILEKVAEEYINNSLPYSGIQNRIDVLLSENELYNSYTNEYLEDLKYDAILIKATDILRQHYPKAIDFNLHKTEGHRSEMLTMIDEVFDELSSHYDIYSKENKELKDFAGQDVSYKEIETLIKAKDVIVLGRDFLDNPPPSFHRPSEEQLKKGFEAGYFRFDEVIQGYFIDNSFEFGGKIPTNIQRISEMNVFDDDFDAATTWALDYHGSILEEYRDIWISEPELKNYQYPALDSNIDYFKSRGEWLDKAVYDNFDWSEFPKDLYVLLQDEAEKNSIPKGVITSVKVGGIKIILNAKEDNIKCQIVSCNDYVESFNTPVYRNEAFDFSIPYENIKNFSYGVFKYELENSIIQTLEKNNDFKKLAMYNTPDWNNLEEMKKFDRKYSSDRLEENIETYLKEASESSVEDILSSVNRTAVYNPEDYGLLNEGNDFHVLVEYDGVEADTVEENLNSTHLDFEGKKVIFHVIDDQSIEQYLEHMKEHYEKEQQEVSELDVHNIISETVNENLKDFLNTNKDCSVINKYDVLADTMNNNSWKNRIDEPEITDDAAKAILYYCNYGDYELVKKDSSILILDVSEDYSGEGEVASNKDLVYHAHDCADSCKDYGSGWYDEEKYDILTDLCKKFNAVEISSAVDNPDIKEIQNIIDYTIPEDLRIVMDFSQKINETMKTNKMAVNDNNIASASFFVLKNMDEKNRQRTIEIMQENHCTNPKKTSEFLKKIQNNDFTGFDKYEKYNQAKQQENIKSKNDDVSMSD